MQLQEDSNSGDIVPAVSSTSSWSEEVWNKYFERLLHFARKQMRGMPKVASDEEDITLSVLKSVCLAVRKRNGERADDAPDTDSIWGMLVLICKRKIANQYAYQRRSKRDASRSESLYSSPTLLQQLESKEIRPEMLTQFNERIDELFETLEHDSLKKVARAKAQGYTNQEIAERLSCSLSTVERKLRLIREIWSRESESD
ncbi:MAG: ECF-type sigma factor [Planctomycetota bacterium]